MKILLVEDEETVSAPLQAYLKKDGLRVTLARSLQEARAQLSIGELPDLILLDWMLPDGQGVELLRELRQQGRDFPVIFLTARADLVDKVVGLELGANDYLTKPFEPRELLARIRVQLRLLQSAPRAKEESQVLRASGISLNATSREVRYEGQVQDLTKTEFELLKLLLQFPNQVFSREELLKKVWGYENYPTTRTVDTHILQLRSKFHPDIFETVHGVGYRLRILTNVLQGSDNSG